MKNLTFSKKEGNIGWLEWNQANSPVNLLSFSFMEELEEIIKNTDPSLKALVFISKKQNHFCAGADINDIQKIKSKKELKNILDKVHDLFDRFEKLDLFKIVAIEGSCLGGGLEWALCFDWRLAGDSPSTRLALPETRLGLIPGFGGCLRLPRLTGLKNSLSLIPSGKTLSSRQALQINLVDERVPSLVLEKRALELAQNIVTKREQPLKKTFKNQKAFSFFIEKTFKHLIGFYAKNQILKKTKGFYPAPLKALELIQKTYGKKQDKKDFNKEKSAFCELHESSVSQNLIRIFQMTKQAQKIKTNSQIKKPIERIGILGAGVMGRSIAWLLLDKAFSVRLVDTKEESLVNTLKWVKQMGEKQLAKKQINSYEFKRKINRLSVSPHLWGFSNMDLVIEALPENKQLKENVIREVSKKLSPHCLFASNTSSLSIKELSQHSSSPENFFGLHFFNPAHKMPLLEIILTDQQKDLFLAPLSHFVKKLGKVPVFAKDSPGFIVNRLLAVYLTEALLLYEEGFDIERLDDCYSKQFGFPMGPFQLMDKIGLDICTSFIHQLKSSGLNFKVPSWTPELTQTLGLGEKSGQGFYNYKGTPPRQNEKLKQLKRKSPLDISDEVIIQRGIYRMINEAFLLLKEEKVQSEEDIDLALVMGLGFPPFLGGPMKYARDIGLSHIKNSLEKLSHQYGERFKTHFSA